MIEFREYLNIETDTSRDWLKKGEFYLIFGEIRQGGKGAREI